MPLIKHGAVVDDPWRTVADGEPLPDEGPVIVSATRWQAERDALQRRQSPVGVCLRADELASTLGADAAHLALIAIEFPSFRDGRAYSTARLLRERYAFKGELRAVGDVLRDQLLFMHRCGFDAFAVESDNAVQQWTAALGEISVVYQTAADREVPATRLRQMRRAAE